VPAASDGGIYTTCCMTCSAGSFGNGRRSSIRGVRDHRGVRLYHRLAAAAAAQKPGEIAHEAVIPHCLQPMEDPAFAELLAASGLLQQAQEQKEAEREPTDVA
jgi:hypothetical protein